MRLLRNRLVRACAIFLLGAGCGFLAKTIAAYTERSRFIGQLQQRIEAERRAVEALAGIINESGHILKRMEDSIGGTAEGVSGVAGRLRIYASPRNSKLWWIGIGAGAFLAGMITGLLID
jgi:hypothetical protein